MDNILVSVTGVVSGFGSDKWKRVSYLTKEERDHVRSGGTVLVRLDGDLRSNQTRYKQVTYYKGRYGHHNYYGPTETLENEYWKNRLGV